MRIKSSIIVPVIAIIAGVLLQLNSFGVIGEELIPADIMLKLWPLLLAVAALDLLLTRRRVLGGLVLMFTAAALFSTQFLDSGTANELWQVFLKFWPILLILFGLDAIFSGGGIVNAVVLIIGILILVYVLLAALNVPILRELPFDLSSITSVLTAPDSYRPEDSSSPSSFRPVSELEKSGAEAAPIVTGTDGKITIRMPNQNAAQINLNAASGRLSLKAGADSSSLLSGSIKLDSKESLTHDASLNGSTAVYNLYSKGSAKDSDASIWDLALSARPAAGLNITMGSGYIKADLRNLNLNTVNIENQFGPIDVMAPQSAAGKLTINAGNGNVRLYLPKNVRISCTISGTTNIEYPQRNYTLNGSSLSPRSSAVTPIEVTISSNGGQVRIIESE